jgi:hypothetical protein
MFKVSPVCLVSISTLSSPYFYISAIAACP